MPEAGESKTVSSLTWGLFLLIVLLAIFISAGVPVGPLLVLGFLFAVAFSFRYIYFVFYLATALVPMFGVMVMIPTGSLAFGQRAFGGAIDVSLAEVILFFVLAAWMLRILLYWRGRHDWNWRPQLPLLSAYLPLVAAHALSALSPLGPDPYVVIKFALRPVFYNYLAFLALPYNLIRSRRSLRTVLAVICGVGALAALNGLFSMFFPSSPGSLLGRAHPFPLFGVDAFGENHNELAELLVFTAPFTLALHEMIRDQRSKRVVLSLALLQFAVGLFTFTRTIWGVFAVQAVLLSLSVFRTHIRALLPKIAFGALFVIPLAIGMVFYSISGTAQSSNSTRLMLTEIALQVFETSPIFGGGAGSFMDRVGSTRVFLLEYGAPLDSHGFIQKLLAETGSLGLLALAIFTLFTARYFYRALKSIGDPLSRRVFIFLLVGALSAFAYQFFNTDYWTGKMWLPIGIALAASAVLRDSSKLHEDRF